MPVNNPRVAPPQRQRPPARTQQHEAPAVLGPEQPNLRRLTAPPKNVQRVLKQLPPSPPPRQTPTRKTTPREQSVIPSRFGNSSMLPGVQHTSAFTPAARAKNIHDLGLPQNATDKQILDALIRRGKGETPTPHHSSSILGQVFEGIKNVPGSAARQVAGLASIPSGLEYAGQAATDAAAKLATDETRAVLQLTGQQQTAASVPHVGEYDKGKAVLNAQLQSGLDVFRPSVWRDDPVRNLLTVAPGIGALGRLAGAARGLEATSRVITPADRIARDAEGVPVAAVRTNKGSYSTNLFTRGVQRAIDKAQERSPAAGSRAVARRSNEVRAQHETIAEHRTNAILQPVLKTAAGQSRSSQRAAIYAHGQLESGTPLSDLARLYRQTVADLRTREPAPELGEAAHTEWQQRLNTAQKQLDLWSKLHEKFGNARSEPMESLVQASRDASRKVEGIKQTLPRPNGAAFLSEQAAKRSAFLPTILTREAKGDPLAEQYLAAEQEAVDRLTAAKKARATGAPNADALEGQAHQAAADARSLLDQVSGHAGPLTSVDPLYVHHGGLEASRPAQLRSVLLGRRSRNVTRSFGGEGKHRTGAAFVGGAYRPDPEIFFGSLARAPRIQTALEHLQAQISELAIPARDGMRYDRSLFERIAPDGGPRELPATAKGKSTEAITRAIEEAGHPEGGGGLTWDHVLSHLHNDPADHAGIAEVPAGSAESYLVPKEALHNLQNEFKGGRLSGIAGLAIRATRFWKWATLLARPAWLTANLVSNTALAGLAGAGPRDFAAAARRERMLVPGVDNRGFFANYFDQTHRLGQGGDLSFGVKQGIKSVGEELRQNPAKAVYLVPKTAANLAKEANIAYENLARRAVFERAIRKHLPGQASDELNRMLEAAQRGDAPSVEAAAKRSVDMVNDFLGDFTKYRRNSGLDFAFPFRRWILFMATHTLGYLPMKYPGRALLLSRLGQLGMRVDDQRGWLPQYLQGSIGTPFGVLSTQSLNPWATVTQTLGVDRSKSGGFTPLGLLNQTNPIVTSVLAPFAGFDPRTGQKLTSAKYNPATMSSQEVPAGFGAENFRAAGYQLSNLVPLVGTLQGRSGRAPTGEKYPPGYPLAQPEQTAAQRALAYLTGVNVRPFDYKKNQEAQARRYLKDRGIRAK